MRARLQVVIRWILPGLSDIIWIAAFFGAVLIGPRMMNMDGDLGRHLTIGESILQQGHPLTVDTFSHTMYAQPVTPHEWLAQVVFALAHRALGLDGVILVSAVVIALSFWLVFRSARALSQGLLSSVLAAVLAVAAASLHWLARPHIFTFLLLAFWWKVLEDLRTGKTACWWLLPAAMLVWANLHGAFIAGFVTWALFGAGAAWDAFFTRSSVENSMPVHKLGFWRAFLLGGLSSLAVTLINPSGIGLWSTSVGYVGSRYLVGHTAEYLPPDFHNPVTWPFLLMIGMFVVFSGLQGGRVKPAHLFPAAAWLIMSLYSARNVPLFAIIAAPPLAGAVHNWLVQNASRLKAIRSVLSLDQRLFAVDTSLRGLLWPITALVMTAAAFAGGASLDLAGQGNRFDGRIFPVQAADWLAANPQDGNMANYFPWGGYLLYRMWPVQRVFIDGQTDFYGESLTREYEQLLTVAPGWKQVLDRYTVEWIVFPVGESLTAELREQPDWQVVYEDDTAVIFTRR